jgi:hypothetical protein
VDTRHGHYWPPISWLDMLPYLPQYLACLPSLREQSIRATAPLIDVHARGRPLAASKATYGILGMVGRFDHGRHDVGRWSSLGSYRSW